MPSSAVSATRDSQCCVRRPGARSRRRTSCSSRDGPEAAPRLRSGLSADLVQRDGPQTWKRKRPRPVFSMRSAGQRSASRRDSRMRRLEFSLRSGSRIAGRAAAPLVCSSPSRRAGAQRRGSRRHALDQVVSRRTSLSFAGSGHAELRAAGRCAGAARGRAGGLLLDLVLASSAPRPAWLASVANASLCRSPNRASARSREQHAAALARGWARRSGSATRGREGDSVVYAPVTRAARRRPAWRGRSEFRRGVRNADRDARQRRRAVRPSAGAQIPRHPDSGSPARHRIERARAGSSISTMACPRCVALLQFLEQPSSSAPRSWRPTAAPSTHERRESTGSLGAAGERVPGTSRPIRPGTRRGRETETPSSAECEAMPASLALHALEQRPDSSVRGSGRRGGTARAVSDAHHHVHADSRARSGASC